MCSACRLSSRWRTTRARAAGELSITQTALSRRLQNLESFLGVRLVERSTRSVALTPPGGVSRRRRAAGC